jgi:hypothetical protein
MCYPNRCLNRMCEGKLFFPKKIKRFTRKCLLSNIKRLYKNYALVFNEFTSISAILDENETTKFYNLDEIE